MRLSEAIREGSKIYGEVTSIFINPYTQAGCALGTARLFTRGKRRIEDLTGDYFSMLYHDDGPDGPMAADFPILALPGLAKYISYRHANRIMNRLQLADLLEQLEDELLVEETFERITEPSEEKETADVHF